MAKEEKRDAEVLGELRSILRTWRDHYRAAGGHHGRRTSAGVERCSLCEMWLALSPAARDWADRDC